MRRALLLSGDWPSDEAVVVLTRPEAAALLALAAEATQRHPENAIVLRLHAGLRELTTQLQRAYQEDRLATGPGDPAVDALAAMDLIDRVSRSAA